MNSSVEETQVVIPHYHGGPGHRIWLGNFIKHFACRDQVATFGISGENGVPGEGGLEGNFVEHAVGIGEGADLGVEIEEVVHEEDAEAKAVFDDSSVNASSDERVSGFECGLEKVDACV